LLRWQRLDREHFLAVGWFGWRRDRGALGFRGTFVRDLARSASEVGCGTALGHWGSLPFFSRRASMAMRHLLHATRPVPTLRVFFAVFGCPQCGHVFE